MHWFLSTACMLISGTVISITSKTVYELQSTGIDGELKYFRKPWFQTALMFVAQMLCGPLYIVTVRYSQWQHERRKNELTPLLEDQLPPDSLALAAFNARELLQTPFRGWQTFMALVPTIADLLATACTLVGLLFVTASVSQLLRGAELIICAVMSITILRNRLGNNQWAGLMLVTAGLVLVAVANIGQDDLSETQRMQTAIGFALIVLAQVFQAAQSVLEEYCLRGLQFEPMLLLGYEGLCGAIICCGIVLPALYFIPGEDVGSAENSLDSVVMVVRSWPLILFELADTLGMLVYNYFALCVTSDLGAVYCCVFDALRTLLVWICDVFLYYVVTNGTLGEPWTDDSFIQLLGFAFIVGGSLLYNRDIEFIDTWTMPPPSPSLAIPPAAQAPAKRRSLSISRWLPGAPNSSL